MRTNRSLRNCVISTLWAACLFSPVLNHNLSGQSQVPEAAKKTFTVVIDPGHGGKHPGAVGKISKEKDIVLSISLKAGEYISSLMPDVEVIYTRTSDVYVDLYKRADLANQKNADLFISIHANGNKNSSIYGAETYVMGPSKSQRNLELAMKENSVINIEDNQAEYEDFNPDDESDYIKFSLYQNIYINHSLAMASQVQDQMRIRAKRKDGGVRQGPFLVLWRTTMPSVLIETGYMSNTAEEQYLNTENGQDIIASAIYRAFRNYKEEFEANSAETIADAALEDKSLDEKDNKSGTVANKELIIENKVDTSIVKQENIGTKDKTASEKQKNDGLVFRVQLIASKEPIEAGSVHFKGVENLKSFKIGEYYKYMTDAVESYSESQEIRKSLSSKFPGAFIVAFLNGDIIPLKEAIKIDTEN